MFGHDEHDNGNNPANDNHHDDSAAADDLIKPTAGDNGNDWHHPGPPPSNDSDDGSDDTNHDQPADTPEPPAPANDHVDTNSAGNDLIDLKREALTKLSPLVDKLEQTPDEKFRTIMMMIQASDNQDLVKQAYEAALGIDDEKERAQALLDIVNEINYFTHNQAKPE